MFKRFQIDKALSKGLMKYGLSSKKEVCGIIIGKITSEDDNNNKEAIGIRFVPIENVSKDEQEIDYLMNPKVLGKVLFDTKFMNKKAKDDFVCIFHTHPLGRPSPSWIDISRAEYDVVYIIYSPYYNDMKAYTFDKQNREFYEIELVIK